ncbi:NAD-dependent epimerase/dehydratase family protein [Nocardia sp. CA-129566]|uniref:NAD-dependent epimerase/dehydratase family protein n=1 Tax=Nocardia sp. CA-129566 TaxID=3239976 RepID=UPI003D98D867
MHVICDRSCSELSKELRTALPVKIANFELQAASAVPPCLFVWGDQLPRAVVLGGGGFIGSTITRHLLTAGWDVTVAGWGAPAMTQELASMGAEVHSYPREDAAQLRRSVGSGADAFIDVIAYRAEDIGQLDCLRGLVGSLIVISSGAVYRGVSGKPYFGNYDTADWFAPLTIDEAHPILPPDDMTYGGGKVAVERAVRALRIAPTSIVRPFAVFGPNSTAAREWYFVKRVLDRRERLVLCGDGHEKFNRCSVDNLAEIIRLCCESPGDRTVNAADHDPHDVLGIARQIAAHLEWEWEEFVRPGPPPAPMIGYTPWSTPARVTAGMAHAEAELGYRAIVTPERTLEVTTTWLADYMKSNVTDWHAKLPGYFKRNGNATFCYAAEDDFISRCR